jgi:hypothetical protein
MPLDPEDDEFPEGEPVDLHSDTPPKANVDPTMTGPEASSATAQPSEEPQAGIGEARAEQAGERADEGAVEPPLPEFDPRMKEAFEGLMYLGRLTQTFRFLGHTFVIKTLTTDETLQVGLLQRPFRDTMGDLRAYTAATAAACVVSVDGQPLPLPLTNLPDEDIMAQRFRYVRLHWYPVVLDRVYEEYLLLEAKVAEVIKAMGEALG